MNKIEQQVETINKTISLADKMLAKLDDETIKVMYVQYNPDVKLKLWLGFDSDDKVSLNDMLGSIEFSETGDWVWQANTRDLVNEAKFANLQTVKGKTHLTDSQIHALYVEFCDIVLNSLVPVLNGENIEYYTLSYKLENEDYEKVSMQIEKSQYGIYDFDNSHRSFTWLNMAVMCEIVKALHKLDNVTINNIALDFDDRTDNDVDLAEFNKVKRKLFAKLVKELNININSASPKMLQHRLVTLERLGCEIEDIDFNVNNQQYTISSTGTISTDGDIDNLSNKVLDAIKNIKLYVEIDA